MMNRIFFSSFFFLFPGLSFAEGDSDLGIRHFYLAYLVFWGIFFGGVLLFGMMVRKNRKLLLELEKKVSEIEDSLGNREK